MGPWRERDRLEQETGRRAPLEAIETGSASTRVSVTKQRRRTTLPPAHNPCANSRRRNSGHSRLERSRDRVEERIELGNELGTEGDSKVSGVSKRGRRDVVLQLTKDEERTVLDPGGGSYVLTGENYVRVDGIGTGSARSVIEADDGRDRYAVLE